MTHDWKKIPQKALIIIYINKKIILNELYSFSLVSSSSCQYHCYNNFYLMKMKLSLRPLL